MNRQRFIPLKDIINRVHLNGGDIVNDVTEDDIITYTIELLGIVGVPMLFEEKVANLEVKKHRAELPCDFVEEKGIKCCDQYLNASTDIFKVEDSNTYTPTYKINGNFIVTSIESGHVQLSYTAVKTDEEGYPMIVDDQSFIRALVSYIIYQKVYTNYINGRLPSENIMERVERNYEFNIAQATQKLTLPTVDEFDNICRLMNSFVFRHNSRHTGFKDIGDEAPIESNKSNIASFGFIDPKDN